MRIIRETKETPVLAEVDVLIAGGGPAGIAAAATAARCGVNVMLIERYGCLGGLATGGLVLLMDHLYDSDGKRCIGGITWELMERLDAIGGLAGKGTTRLHADSELLKIAADQLCLESGVTLRFHSWIADAITADGKVSAVVVESKSGRQAIAAQVFVDATGDGDIAAFAGAAFESYTMRIGLNCKIGGVNREEFLRWKEKNPEEAGKIHSAVLSYGGCRLGLGLTPYSDKGVFWVNNLGLGRREGDNEPVAVGDGMYTGGLSALDVDDLSFVEIETRKRILRALEFYRKYVPGYQEVRLLSIASQIGVRDSRRIVARHRVTAEEMARSVYYDDTIGLTAMSFKEGNHLRVPYRSLVPQKTDGLLAAGRCIDAGDGVIHSIRLIPPCMMTGQAAGTAAAMCVERKIEPRDLSYAELRKRLEAEGVILAD